MEGWNCVRDHLAIRGGTERAEEFEEAYGPGGAWTVLFSAADGYLGTELLRDAERIGVYLTIDRWASESAYRAFRTERAEEYAELDERCGRLTLAERAIGVFAALPGGRV